MSKQSKTALLTGGNGNLGRLVADRLLDAGFKVVSFDLPGTEPDATRQASGSSMTSPMVLPVTAVDPL